MGLPRRALGALSTLALSGALLVVAPMTTYAATPSCDGRAATVVGTPGQVVMGTDGDDVIVSAGAVKVEAGGGHDSICVTTPTGDDTDDDVFVETTDGGDHIDARAAGVDVQSLLSGGGTTYLGSSVQDVVQTAHDAHDPVDDGPDVIRTGDGADDVLTGSKGTPDADHVATGAGADEVELFGLPGDGALDLGAGRDDLVLYDGSRLVAWRVALDLHQLDARGAYEPLTGVEDVDLTSTFRWERFDYVGTPGNDVLRVDALGPNNHRGSFHADLGAGDDRAYVERGLKGPVVGGPGRDRFWSEPNRGANRVDAHLAGGRLRSSSRTMHVTSFASFVFDDLVRARVVGSPGPDRIAVDACSTSVDGGGGDDVLVATVPQPGLDDTQCPHRAPRVRARLDGGPGADRLVGTRDRDVLRGGPGRDRVVGHGGHDVCRAERTRSCR